LEATFERIRITRESIAIPPALSIRAWGSMKSQNALGMPVLLKPSTVINIPTKKINKEYETWFALESNKSQLILDLRKRKLIVLLTGICLKKLFM